MRRRRGYIGAIKGLKRRDGYNAAFNHNLGKIDDDDTGHGSGSQHFLFVRQ